MDCIIPRHSIRLFCSSIACWSRLGKDDIYLDFHPLEGLVLRTLNDASTAFGCIRFRPSFFERCTAPPPSSASSSGNKRRRSTTSSVSGPTLSSTHPGGDEDDDEGRFACRLPLRALAAIVRPRKQAISLRIQSDQSNPVTTVLQFTFLLCTDGDASAQPLHGDASYSSTTCKVVHRIPADLAGACQQPVLSEIDSSEMLATSRTWLKWLDPLKRTHEVAVVVSAPTADATNQALSAASFHPTADITSLSLSAATATLKTETALEYDDLLEMEYIQDRRDDGSSDDQPEGVNEQVVLVFPLKPVKALLQFCLLDEKNDGTVGVSFTWGGQPVVWQAKSGDQHWSVQLVVATLDHKRLA